MIFGKPLGAVGGEDLESLRVNEVAEGRQLDYKRDLPGTSRSEVREFLEDVTSFANTAGGVILFGVEEAQDGDGKGTGLPSKFCGVGSVNLDNLRLRWGDQLRQSVEPPLHAFQVTKIRGHPEAEGAVIALEIRPSLLAPHRVRAKGSPGFYHRTAAGKAPMDVEEIRRAFLFSASQFHEARELRAKRNDLAPSRMAGGTRDPLLTLHCFPLGRLDGHRLDVAAERDEIVKGPLGEWSNTYGLRDTRLNFDGYAIETYRAGTSKPVRRVQILRFGGAELLFADIGHQSEDDSNTMTRVRSHELERLVFSFLAASVAALQELGISPPFAAFSSLLNGTYLYLELPGPFNGLTEPLGEESLLFEGIVIESEDDLDSALGPLWEHMLNAWGKTRTAV